MRNSILSSSLLLVLLYSCGQTKVDTKKAFAFFDAVNAQIILNKPEQQKFIDKLTAALLEVKENSKALIDTKELQSLLEYSKTKNIEREKNIEKLIEVDNDISYKQKTMDYVKAFNDAYQNEFPKCIQILVGEKDGRLETAGKLIYPKLKLIKEKEIEMKSAQNAFETKYEELSKVKGRKTEGDYEFIKLKDFKFTLAPIEDGAKIVLLSFSGGKQNADDKIYYKQFIGINKSTGDTLRILALAAIQQYDIDKAPRIGTFKADLPMRNQMTPSENEYIIFNTNQADIEKGNYRTVFGVLSFDE